MKNYLINTVVIAIAAYGIYFDINLMSAAFSDGIITSGEMAEFAGSAMRDIIVFSILYRRLFAAV